ATGTGVGAHLDQRELARHRVVVVLLDDLDDVDQLVELLGDLLERGLLGGHHDGHPRHVLLLGGTHRQRLDVETAPREQRRDPSENAGLVFDQHRERMGLGDHQACPSVMSSNSGRMPRACWISSLLVPAATIGHTCASAPTMKSITTGRSLIARAWLITSTTSSARSQRNPTQPSASASLTKSGIRREWVARSVCEYRSL